MDKPQFTQLTMTSEGRHFNNTPILFSKQHGLSFLHHKSLSTQNKVIISKAQMMSEAYIMCQLIYFQYKNI